MVWNTGIVTITAKCKVNEYKFILLLQYQLMILNIAFLVLILKGDKIMELKEFVMEIAKDIEAGLEGVNK